MRIMILPVAGILTLAFWLLSGCTTTTEPSPADDFIPPGQITDLQVAGDKTGGILLRWTAVGDDGNEGRATEYLLRYDIAPISPETWPDAAPLEGVVPPAHSGTSQEFRVEVLPGNSPLFFGLKARDEAGNESPISTAACQDADPLPPVRDMVLTPLWKTEDLSSAPLFGQVVDVVLQDGEIFMLDTMLSEIQVFDLSGTHLRTIGQEGEDIGEFHQGLDLALNQDNTLTVMQAIPPRFVNYSLDGTPLSDFAFSQPSPHVLVLMGLRHGPWGVQLAQRVSGLDAEQDYFFDFSIHNVLGTMETGPAVWQMANSGLDWQNLTEEDIDTPTARWNCTSTGMVILAPDRNNYRILGLGNGGEQIFTIEQDYTTWERSAEALEQADNLFNPPGSYSQIAVSPTAPDVATIECPFPGEFWVQTSRALWEPPAGLYTVYDRFGEDGTSLGQIHLFKEGQAREENLFWLSSEFAAAVRLIPGQEPWEAAQTHITLYRAGGTSHVPY